MSVRKMIGLHPKVAGHVNEPLALAAKHAMYCALFTTSCADACSAEGASAKGEAASGIAGDMSQCIRTCMDCSDVCTAAAKVATRMTGDDDAMVRATLTACIEACMICAAECDKHDHEHCRLCATMCRECADDCREALATLH
ncbi:four-helix bundle copper-binding protein [Sphingomonas sp. BIUV-7]|uniref:Four-helix bundle copper-binding protein n=1 Tax=Sphingomonas natans TaxID=3063330 RepID=A0ABT8YEW5_9SPHN|nr:four-helix bundle copper-binding protein [Sphingomonas sp. BIUV-7]MDO6416487.1 four-helix bundle copper-binding protein [Sphingomonas sp. BIUV-7]